MARRSIVYTEGFSGLSRRNSPLNLRPDKAVVANNVIITAGRVETRPGRLELTEDQRPDTPCLGLASYTPPGESFKSLIIVKPDGVYRRNN